jgi:hypothetical protein
MPFFKKTHPEKDNITFGTSTFDLFYFIHQSAAAEL